MSLPISKRAKSYSKDLKVENLEDCFIKVSAELCDDPAAGEGSCVKFTVDGSTLLGSNTAHSVLHWGICDAGGGEWLPVDSGRLPVGAVSTGDSTASQTPFSSDGRCTMTFRLKPSEEGFSGMALPPALSFVVKQAVPNENWWKAEGGHNFYFAFDTFHNLTKKHSCGDVTALAAKYVKPEAEFENWSQFQRFDMCGSTVYGNKVEFNEMAWITTVLRLASIRQLDWYRNYNYQPKDFSHVQERLAVGLTMACVNDEMSLPSKALARLCMSYVPRGSSGSGDEIRMRILNIMRTHGIREGHRPGIEDQFLEQWHQKLHTNSASDDIKICEAYIYFLGTGNANDLYDYLGREAHLTREKLAALPHPITRNPIHLPQLKHDMEKFLGLLKSVHSGADLDFITQTAKGSMSHEAECMIFDVLNNRHEWWVPEKINECRRKLQSDRWKRDVQLLDCALENWQMVKLGALHVEHEAKTDILLGSFGVLVDAVALSRGGDGAWAAASFFWHVKNCEPSPWTEDWAKMMLAAIDRVILTSVYTVDLVSKTMQQCADALADAVSPPHSASIEKLQRSHVTSFGEESARSLIELHVSRVGRALTKRLRQAANLTSWEVASTITKGPVKGKLLKLSRLDAPEVQNNTQLQSREGSYIVLCDTLTGWEDIPVGISAVLTSPNSQVDVLSHIAIRARSQNVFLASCADLEEWQSLTANFGSIGSDTADKSLPCATLSVDQRHVPSLTVNLAPDDTTASKSVSQGVAVGGDATPVTVASARKMDGPMSPFVSPSTWISTSDNVHKFPEHVGKKSWNLLNLQGGAAKSDTEAYERPLSCCVLFGAFENELGRPENSDIRKLIEKNSSLVKISEASLEAIRNAITYDMVISEEFCQLLLKSLASTHGDVSETTEGLLDAARKVWASKWNYRAVASRFGAQFPDEALKMGVLVQKLVEADYAFVIHTRNPLDGASNCSLIEIVQGLGETLVSNTPGRALTCAVTPTGSGQVQVSVLNYPSKDFAMFAPSGGTFIFRSDSNGEDLPDFAGAGLYDSFAVRDCHQRGASYAGDKLVTDPGFRESLLGKLYNVGQLVKGTGEDQDVEGCVKNGCIFIVQTRRQM